MEGYVEFNLRILSGVQRFCSTEPAADSESSLPTTCAVVFPGIFDPSLSSWARRSPSVKNVFQLRNFRRDHVDGVVVFFIIRSLETLVILEI